MFFQVLSAKKQSKAQSCKLTVELLEDRLSPAWLTNPAPSVTQVAPDTYVLRKELSGYGNYGVADRAADVLYSHESGSWTYELSSLLGSNLRVRQAEFSISGVLDDHYNVSGPYVGSISTNGGTQFTGSFPYAHGAPFGQVFNNWSLQTVPVTITDPTAFTIAISNDSNLGGGDWIAMDYISLRVVLEPRQPDLTGTFSSVPGTATAGRSISVSANISNSGQVRVTGAIDVGFYLSTDGTLDPGDTRVGTFPIQVDLAPGQSIPFTTAITIPGSTAGGIYRLIAKVDDGNVIDEGSNEGNNTTVSGPLTVRRLSGAEWVNAFPGSRSLDDLNSAFGNNVRRFINAVQAGGATVDIISTFRPPERAYLMHWSWLIARENYAADSVPSMNGVYIEWWHGSQDLSRAAAREMVNAFGIQNLQVAPALNSNHTLGLAIDMAITWTGNLTVIDGNGVARTIRGGPRDSTNRDLIDIAATFNVIHFIDAHKDRNHWSIDGR